MRMRGMARGKTRQTELGSAASQPTAGEAEVFRHRGWILGGQPGLGGPIRTRLGRHQAPTSAAVRLSANFWEQPSYVTPFRAREAWLHFSARCTAEKGAREASGAGRMREKDPSPHTHQREEPAPSTASTLPTAHRLTK